MLTLGHRSDSTAKLPTPLLHHIQNKTNQSGYTNWISPYGYRTTEKYLWIYLFLALLTFSPFQFNQIFID